MERTEVNAPSHRRGSGLGETDGESWRWPGGCGRGSWGGQSSPLLPGTKGDTPDGQGGAGPWKALEVQLPHRQRPGASSSAGPQRKE